VVILLLVIFYFHEFIALSFDETFVKIQGKNVFFLNSLLFAVIGITVVALVKAIGVVLVVSMLTIPASIVMMYCKDMRKIMFFNGLLTFVFSIMGIIISYFLDWGSTPAIIIPMVLCYLVATAVKART
jgi:zinc transport system permease protein